MHIVTFVVALIFFLIAATFFGYGLVQLFHQNQRARGTIGTGFITGLLGVVIAAILFGFFSL